MKHQHLKALGSANNYHVPVRISTFITSTSTSSAHRAIKMSSRKLNPDELKLHQTALAANDKVRPHFPSSNRQSLTTEIDIIYQGCRETGSRWKCSHCCHQLFARGGVSFSAACVPGGMTSLQGMFKVMTSSGGVTAFRAVMKKEMDVCVLKGPLFVCCDMDTFFFVGKKI